MPTRLVRILQLLISLLLPLLFIFGTVRLLVTDGYLAYEYAKTGFPPDPFGFDRGQRLALASANFRYVRERQPLDALASQRLAGQPAYNARELKHMQDVQDVFQAGWLAWKVGLLAIVLCAVALGWTAATRPALAAAVKAGGLITTGLVGAAGLLAVLAWQLWFVAFHQIFFAAGTWTFEYTDTLIRLFPEKFWFDAALTVAGLSVAGGLAVALAGWRLERHRPATLPASASITPSRI